MTPTTPSREDWELLLALKLKHLLDYYNLKKADWGNMPYNQFQEYNFGDVIDYVRNLLKSHNNALVAEIEKHRQNDDFAQEIGDNYLIYYKDGFNQALDTIIRIIQEK